MTTEASPYLTLPIRSEEAVRMRAALMKIASGTLDDSYPFRAMPRERMQKLAQEALSTPPHTEGGREGT